MSSPEAVALLERGLFEYDSHRTSQVELAAAVAAYLRAQGWGWNPETRRHLPPPVVPEVSARPLAERNGFTTFAQFQGQLTKLAAAAYRLVQEARQHGTQPDSVVVGRSYWNILRTSMPPGWEIACDPKEPPAKEATAGGD